MAWRAMQLREQRVLARVNEQGELVAEGGRVEIRYNAASNKSYRAAAANLAVIPGAPVLADEHCVSAEPAAKDAVRAKSKAPAKAKGPAKKSAGASAVRSVKANEVEVWADGACSGNPGPAGLGLLARFDGQRIERSEYLGHGTNNVAELSAIERALHVVEDKARPLVIFTDSQYSIGVLAGGWKAKANQELIASIRAQLAERQVRFVHVRGHAGIALNERVDELARAALQSKKTKQTTSEDKGAPTAEV